MADIDKGLPVRTEDDADQKIQSKIVDHTTPSQGAEVDTDGNLHTESHGNDPGGVDRVMRTSELGHPSIDGIYDGTNNTDPSNIGLITMVRNASPADSQQTLRNTSVANGAGDVRALDVAIRDESGEPWSISNPLPTESVGSSGTPVHDFDEEVDLAADSAADHDYSVADTDVFLFKQFIVSSSSRFKAEVKIGDGAASENFTTKVVVFGSEDNKFFNITFAEPISVTGTTNTTTVRITKTNRDDDDACSVYSTIIGLTKA